MKAIFEHPMYKRIHRIFIFLCFGVVVADLLGFVPEDFLRGRTINVVGIIILFPQIVEDCYYWWQKKKVSKT